LFELFKSLCGDSGMKYGVSSFFELCYKLCIMWEYCQCEQEVCVLRSRHFAVYSDLSYNTLLTLGWSLRCAWLSDQIIE